MFCWALGGIRTHTKSHSLLSRASRQIENIFPNQSTAMGSLKQLEGFRCKRSLFRLGWWWGQGITRQKGWSFKGWTECQKLERRAGGGPRRGQALGWLRNEHQDWDGRRKGDGPGPASVFTPVREHWDAWIFDGVFQIFNFFTNCTRKPFLNLESVMEDNQSYWKRPDRQVSGLAGCPRNGHNRELCVPLTMCFHSAWEACLLGEEFGHQGLPDQTLVPTQKVPNRICVPHVFIWLSSEKPPNSTQSA